MCPGHTWGHCPTFTAPCPRPLGLQGEGTGTSEATRFRAHSGLGRAAHSQQLLAQASSPVTRWSRTGQKTGLSESGFAHGARQVLGEGRLAGLGR